MRSCTQCKDSLFPILGGTRCGTCSKSYIDKLFCDNCLVKDQIPEIKDNLCSQCCNIYQTSKEEFEKKMYEEEKSKGLPDKVTFTDLATQALFSGRTNPYDDYNKIKRIAGGGFGEVYLVEDKDTKKMYAAKIIKLIYEEDRQLIRNEFVLTKLSTHKRIIMYHLLYEIDNEVWIIQDLMDINLTSLLLRRNPIPEKYAITILKSILEGLRFIHSNFRIHRDIKSDNILINFSGDIKICDLGFAAQLTSEDQQRKTLAGTPCWLAPEILMLQPYDMKVDIWAFGIICIELIDGEPPMFRNSMELIMKNTLESEIKPKNKLAVSQDYLHMLSCCLQKNPMSRISSKSLLELPIFANSEEPSDFSEFIKTRYKEMNPNK